MQNATPLADGLLCFWSFLAGVAATVNLATEVLGSPQWWAFLILASPALALGGVFGRK